MAADPSVTLLIPAHNEAPSIGEVIEAARANTPGLIEVRVVDDGSTDDTQIELLELHPRMLTLSGGWCLGGWSGLGGRGPLRGWVGSCQPAGRWAPGSQRSAR